MMSITYDASAGKGDKRINITVFDPDGKHSANATCGIILRDVSGDIINGGGANVMGNGGNMGLFVPENTNTVKATCSNSVPETGTAIVTLIKHTTKLHVHLT